MSVFTFVPAFFQVVNNDSALMSGLRHTDDKRTHTPKTHTGVKMMPGIAGLSVSSTLAVVAMKKSENYPRLLTVGCTLYIMGMCFVLCECVCLCVRI